MADENKKIDEILTIVQAERERNGARFGEVLEIVRTERNLNNSRFSQHSTSLYDLRKEVGEMKAELKQAIHQVFTTLSDDIHAIVGDHTKLKKRVDRIERKTA